MQVSTQRRTRVEHSPIRRGSFLRHTSLIPLVPISVLTAIVVTGLVAPLLTPHSPVLGDLKDRFVPPFWLAGGTTFHPLGTDQLGRDVLTRILYGARTSGAISLSVIGSAGIIGTALGLIAGYYGGKVDLILMRAVDVTLALPALLVAVTLAVFLGPRFVNIIIVTTVLLWAQYARLARAETLSVRERLFVVAAGALGSSDPRIMLKHILPSIVNTLIVLATLQLGFVIVFEASLSFLGAGLPPPTPAWGLMVGEGRDYITSAWWVSFFPGLTLSMAVLCTNLLGDWLRDLLDPKMQPYM